MHRRMCFGFYWGAVKAQLGCRAALCWRSCKPKTSSRAKTPLSSSLLKPCRTNCKNWAFTLRSAAGSTRWTASGQCTSGIAIARFCSPTGRGPRAWPVWPAPWVNFLSACPPTISGPTTTLGPGWLIVTMCITRKSAGLRWDRTTPGPPGCSHRGCKSSTTLKAALTPAAWWSSTRAMSSAAFAPLRMSASVMA